MNSQLKCVKEGVLISSCLLHFYDKVKSKVSCFVCKEYYGVDGDGECNASLFQGCRLDNRLEDNTCSRCAVEAGYFAATDSERQFNSCNYVGIVEEGQRIFQICFSLLILMIFFF